MTRTLWVCVIVNGIICTFCGNAKQMVNFTSSTLEFTHLTVNDNTGDVYVGGGNYVYRLDSDLQLIYNITTKPDDGTDNYNKILSINYDYNNLITCGSYRGVCQIRDLSDLSVLNDSVTWVAAPTKEDSTVGFVAPGYDNKPNLYVGTPRRGNAYPGDQAVSGRQLDELLFHSARSWEWECAVDMYWFYENSVIYVTGFSYHRFSYFLTVQRLSRNDNTYISRIVRVCQERNDYYYDSYTEVTLQCEGSDSTLYNLLQAADVMRPASDLATSLSLEDDEHVLFAVFGKGRTPWSLTPLQHSVICIYKMTDIEQAFIDAISGCITQGGDEYQLDHIFESRCYTWDNGGNIPECSTDGLYRYAGGKDPISVIGVMEYPNTLLTSITVTTVQEHTVGFIGTQDGHILKVHFHSYYCNQYDNVILPDPVRVYNDTKFDAYSRYLYVLVEYNVYKLEVQNCKQYTTCRECFEAMDPYCGWCTLERRCSLYNECPFSNIRSRWLSVFSDERCVNITEIEPADSVPKSVHNQITLHVSELPDERNYIPAYECNFGNTSITPANQSGQTLTCETPLTNQRPDIPEGQDHVTTVLYLRSKETNIKFVDTNIHYFNCSFHKSCTNCVSSNWACDWCVYENICTHASDTCMKDSYSSIVVGEHNKFSSRDIRGWSSCPHLEQQDGEVLIHVDEATPIVISAANVPKGNPGFQCVLKGIGFEDYVAATRYNESTVLCHAKQYNYDTNVQEVNVSLTVQWNNNYKIDDIYGYTVTLYDCRIDRKDCSGCLSTITTREELQCGWCVSDSSCQISSHCNRHWWSQDVTENCDDPIISEIYPSSGPYEGDTDIIINGSNLGKMFSLVKSVTVGGRSCTVIQERYRVSRSIECTTQSGDIDYSGEISITVIGNDGKTQTGTSGHVVKFTWRKQRVVGFFPTFGPKAGGTRILISGQYMDAGRNITADIGGSVCSVDREEVNETNIICTSSSHQVTSSASFTVYFDGSARPVTLINYKYLENPVIKNIFPLSSMFSGGRRIVVYGEYFLSVQEPRLVISMGDKKYISKPCDMNSNSGMICFTPCISCLSSPSELSSEVTSRLQKTVCGDACEYATIGFLMDGVEELRELPNYDFKLHEDPEYFPFDGGDSVKRFIGAQLTIQGKNLNFASTREEIEIYIGTETCNVISLADNQVNCIPPVSQPKGVNVNGTATFNDLPEVRVFVGNLEFRIGYIQYPTTETYTAIIVSISVIVLVLFLLIVVVCVVYERAHRKEQKTIKQLRAKFLSLDFNLEPTSTSPEGTDNVDELETDVDNDIHGTDHSDNDVHTKCTSSYEDVQPFTTGVYQSLHIPVSTNPVVMPSSEVPPIAQSNLNDDIVETYVDNVTNDGHNEEVNKTNTSVYESMQPFATSDYQALHTHMANINNDEEATISHYQALELQKSNIYESLQPQQSHCDNESYI